MSRAVKVEVVLPWLLRSDKMLISGEDGDHIIVGLGAARLLVAARVIPPSGMRKTIRIRPRDKAAKIIRLAARTGNLYLLNKTLRVVEEDEKTIVLEVGQEIR